MCVWFGLGFCFAFFFPICVCWVFLISSAEVNGNQQTVAGHGNCCFCFFKYQLELRLPEISALFPFCGLRGVMEIHAP